MRAVPTVRVLSAAVLLALLAAGCSSRSPYDSEALRRLSPIVEKDRSAADSGSPLTLSEVRDEATRLGMATSIGASRGIGDLSVETVNGGGDRRVFAVLDGSDCLFGVVDVTSAPVTSSWLLIEDIYTATKVVPSGTCSASAFFGIDLAGVDLSSEPSRPTRLG